MFGLFKKKGCLHGKTEQQKKEFFKSLIGFATNDKEFFREQWEDLRTHEKHEFHEFVMRESKKMESMKSMVDILEKLLKEKHELK